MTIENYLSDLEDVQDKYNRNWRNPYSSVYATAHERFRETLDDQAKTNQKAAELMVLFASIGMGGGLGALFGTAVMRTVVVRGAVNFVCRNNMNRVFNAMALVEGSPAASYMLGAAWDAAATEITAATRRGVTGLITNAPAQRGIRNPTVFTNDLDNFVLDAKNAAYAVGRDIRDSGLGAAAKTAQADRLRRAPFFRNAPTRPCITNTEKAEKEVELLMYMVLVMDSDELVQRTQGFRGTHEFDRTRSMGRVQQAATGNAYPTSRTVNSSRGAGYSSHTSEYVTYERPGDSWLGSDIMDRANELHRSLFGSPFEQGSYGRDEVQRAERLSQRIQRSYLPTM